MLAHGALLRKNGLSAQQVIAIFADYHNAGLNPEEVHIMDYATRISADPDSVSQADIDLLRQDGFNDQQITDIALAVVSRNFISRFFDALGAQPDTELIKREPELWGFLKDWQKTAENEAVIKLPPASPNLLE